MSRVKVNIEALKKYLTDVNKTQLGQKTGVSPQQVNKILAGSTTFSNYSTIKAIADYLKIDPKYLLENAYDLPETETSFTEETQGEYSKQLPYQELKKENELLKSKLSNILTHLNTLKIDVRRIEMECTL